MKIEQSRVDKAAARRQLTELLPKAGAGFLEQPDPTKQLVLDLEDVGTSEAKLEKDSRNQTSVSGTGGLSTTEPNFEKMIETEIHQKGDAGLMKCVEQEKDSGPDPSSPTCDKKSKECPNPGDRNACVMTHSDITKREESEELNSNDHYLSGRSESDDFEEGEDVSLVLSNDSGQCVTEDESHYITTHEIQLSELSDHEGDFDLGVGSSASWEIEDENQVYSFVDYSFEAEGAAGERGGSPRPRAPDAAAVSTPPENDTRDPAKSPEQSPAQPPQPRGGSRGGQIHLSIRTTSRAINDPGSVQERENILYHARRSGDVSRCVWGGAEGKCFIAAPGRVHFGGKLRGKEVTGYSSGTSSAVSELDDADKEVRTLTARAFKSLAYPYFDHINFSTSSESSASEHGLGINRWSTFVDLKYGNVNVSRGLDQSVVSCQNSTFEIAQNLDSRGYKGAALASIKAPTSKILTLNGNPKNIQLMGQFGQSHGGVIRLTETLNFRCNVKSGMSAEERRTNFAQNAAGSRSTDEVTDGLRSSQRRGASKSPLKTMEDTHKKAVFASSVIKNVISKKMQFEQERKMERGEICEPHQTPSPCFGLQDGESSRGRGGRDLQRQSSRFSESSSDYTLMGLDELGDMVDSSSCETRSDSRRPDTFTPARDTYFEPANEGGIDAKKGAMDASKSTLLRSQNSAFRCWKDEELGFQKDHKNDKTVEDRLPSARDKEGEGDRYSAANSKLTKMSHLFVPSIQVLPNDGGVGQQLPGTDYSQSGHGQGTKLRADNTLYITDSRTVATSKSPEIKINLRSVRENKTESFGVSRLRAPNIGSNAPSLIRTDDFKCQALAAALKGESSDKIPHFMVRDIRDNKGKLQTPIHQVRDVRKLVKSSYHFVSLDNDNKSNCASADSHPDQRKQMHYRNPNSVSPIVIKCQSVNTNSAGRQFGDPDIINRELFDSDKWSPEGAKSAPSTRAPLVMAGDSPEGSIGLRIESKISPNKQEKASDLTERKPEAKIANQAALEKLQAAVKTMEQLYVFERNEWKRKNEPRPLTDSHVLSLIASEEQGGSEEEGAPGPRVDTSYPHIDKSPPASAASPSCDGLRRGDRDLLRAVQMSSGRDDRLPTLNATGSKKTSSLSSNFKASSFASVRQPHNTPKMPLSNKSSVPKAPKLPVSLKVSRTAVNGNVDVESRHVELSERHFSSSSLDNENYLTIPVKSHPDSGRHPPSADRTCVYSFATQSLPTSPPGHQGAPGKGQQDHNLMTKRSSLVMETHSPEVPPATIYHSLPLGMPATQPQLYCFSPAVTPAPALDPFQPTQRKMLLDPSTGNYYLLDTPVQPATRRLFDPETGQYVDVPMPPPPMTPVPVPMSPLALSPGAYGHTYMIYPGFLPAPPVIPARTLVQSQMSAASEAEGGDRASSQQAEGVYRDSPFYMATGKSPRAPAGPPPPAPGSRPPHGFSPVKQPLISITSQQGPRIIAPPSFDGTTMSFVVEHR
ncbi:unnamed protein product [Menidia menidia]|uniref:(Atlantic silverside) hypothetical protein n=1 Tax=Menidia menidia TaxID=238744 RepID=A0A8S4AJE7_9TELE|nr:unnamed protein product [Menidia menidia]CAG5867025.1 unnamed protein product [Menidia menidia]